MISVIIPLMPIEPYATQIDVCLENLEKQTAEHEVILEKQEIKEYIEKNKLLNQGIKKAKGDIIWFCDADFILFDPDLLKGMETKLRKDDLDVIYPMFYSIAHRGYKIADGSAFIKKDVLSKFGKLDESLIGIGGVTFPFLTWCLENTGFHCSHEFLIELNWEPFTITSRINKRPKKTEDKTRHMVIDIIAKLKIMGLWPVNDDLLPMWESTTKRSIYIR